MNNAKTELTRFHTMEQALYAYLDTKIHHILDTYNPSVIKIVPDFNRDSIVNIKEKTDKPFNWKRPTAYMDGDTLIVQCFPGNYYILHYALIKIYHCLLTKQKIPEILIELPSAKQKRETVMKTNLGQVPVSDFVLIGYVDGLLGRSIKWTGNGDFRWHQKKIHDQTVTFLGCEFSYWGDISREIISILAENGAKNVIYIGKLGGLNQELTVNETLATGTESFLKGKRIKWNNLFEKSTSKFIKKGVHYTSPSIILETKQWLSNTKGYDFVDPEIGHMADAANKARIGFSYLHIVSNNLAKNSKENLTNERSKIIRMKRRRLLNEIKKEVNGMIQNYGN
jgi:hypothetical protein